MKFRVHLYREMRLTFNDIEAETHEKAADIATNMETDRADACEDCDGNNIAALVDVVGDDEFKNSKVIDFFDLKPVDRSQQA